MFVLTKLQTVS